MRPLTEFNQHSEQITRLLKNKPDWALSEQVRHLKYALWAESYEEVFKKNIDLANEKIERLVGGRGNTVSADISDSKNRLAGQVEWMNISMKRLRGTLKEVTHKRDGRPFWLLTNMPNVEDSDKGRLIEQARKAIVRMWKVAGGYEDLLQAATDVAPFDFSQFDKSANANKSTEPPSDSETPAPRMDEVREQVLKAVIALKLSVTENTP